jgi:hypothetical protein
LRTLLAHKALSGSIAQYLCTGPALHERSRSVDFTKCEARVIRIVILLRLLQARIG